jgi:hypothetical protein
MSDKIHESTSTIDRQTGRLVKAGGSVALVASMGYFIYCAYAGIVLGGGSNQIFTGVACLFLVLTGCIIIERIVIKNSGQSTEPPENKSP